MESYIDDIAGMVTDDPDVVGEDAAGCGGIAAGGGSVLEDVPMTEEGSEGGHKCKLCGGECGDDKACDTKSCPNNREDTKTEAQPMESKSMKKLMLLKESATGRLSRGMHRLLEVASGGKILSESQWKDKVGARNLAEAKQMGLLKVSKGRILNEEVPEGEPMAEQPPFPGAEAPAPEEEEDGMPGMMGGEGEEEEVEEEMPITRDELAKFLEALKDRADEEALEMITNAIGVEEGMEGGEEGLVDGEGMGDEGEGMGDEGEGMGDEGPLGEEDTPGGDDDDDEETCSGCDGTGCSACGNTGIEGGDKKKKELNDRKADHMIDKKKEKRLATSEDVQINNIATLCEDI